MTINIDNKIIGMGYPTYVIAEVGSNHNGNLDTAKLLIEAAADAGVDAVKFQTFRASEHFSRYAPNFNYLSNQKQTTYELIRSLEINREWHNELMNYAKSCGITFFSSPCDKEAIDQLMELNVAAYKLASFDLPDLEIIRYMARSQKPIIFSTGMANYADIQAGINTCYEEDNMQVALLQCTSLYPAPTKLSNLAAINTMRLAFNCVVGYSDHTIGDHVSIAAVVAGASIIEKHFTLNRNQNGPDHSFAIEPKELKQMTLKIREVECAIGDGIKNGPRLEEMEMYEKGRRSLHVNKNIRAGERIKDTDICIKRPGYGVSPNMLKEIVGMVAKKDIKQDHWLTWEDVK